MPNPIPNRAINRFSANILLSSWGRRGTGRCEAFEKIVHDDTQRTRTRPIKGAAVLLSGQ